MKEIERKFLVNGSGYRALAEGTYYMQGYISSDPDRTIRVRIAGDRAYLTLKTRPVGITRSEFEYGIPPEDARQMIELLCEKPVIEKLRYRIPQDGLVWEVDEFLGDNAGLIVAEIELEDERQTFDRPDWIGREVSGELKYYNSNLIRHPYGAWPAE